MLPPGQGFTMTAEGRKPDRNDPGPRLGSIVVLMPTYNDWDSTAHMLPEIDKEIAALGYDGRVVVIDDGSSVKADLDRFAALPLQAVKRLEIVDLYRNQGNQRAVAIGIAYCEKSDPGDYLILMDSDGQDLPRYIPELVNACRDGGDTAIVFAERTERSEGRLFRFFYAGYQYLYKILTGLPISIGNYSVVPRQMVRRVANIAELWSHFPASIMRAKLPITTIPSFRGGRLMGETGPIGSITSSMP